MGTDLSLDSGSRVDVFGFRALIWSGVPTEQTPEAEKIENGSGGL